MSSQVIPAQAHGGSSYRWELTPTGSTAQFRGLAAVSKDVAWVGGTEGTVLRTVDGGKHWQNVSPTGASALQFRDVEAFDATHAVALSIGNGEDSRSTAPPTAERPGPRRSGTRMRMRSTTASRSTMTSTAWR